jgi:hypothetical protein
MVSAGRVGQWIRRRSGGDRWPARAGGGWQTESRASRRRIDRVMNWLILVTIAVLTFVLFATLLASVEAGYRFGRRRIERNPDVVAGAGVIEAAIFGLMGLLLEFPRTA